jgi:hypothetical protein
VTRGGRRPRAAWLLAAAVLAGCGGCGGGGGGGGEGHPAAAAATTPASAARLERLVVPSVPSGLPRLPDGGVQPPAGEKGVDDVASYAGNPRRERGVLERYGYRFGWERFWGRDAAQTSVFVDQFRRTAGARTFAADLVDNDAAHYGATPHPGTGGLPAGCRLLTVAQAQPAVGLGGPAAFAWCTHGVFSVAVTAVSGSAAGALREVSAVVRAQLGRLPG